MWIEFFLRNLDYQRFFGLHMSLQGRHRDKETLTKEAYTAQCVIVNRSAFTHPKIRKPLRFKAFGYASHSSPLSPTLHSLCSLRPRAKLWPYKVCPKGTPFLTSLCKKNTTAKETIRQGWPFGPPAKLALRVLDRSSSRGALKASRGGMSITLQSSVQRHASGGSPRGMKLGSFPERPGNPHAPRARRVIETRITITRTVYAGVIVALLMTAA